MAIVLHHHPFSRASNVVWMFEEIGCDYELRFVDLRAGEQKAPAFLAKNPMGKLPVIEDDGVVVTETAAIGLYLADRYAPGRLAPALDDPARGTYLRWALFAPSVLEPACASKAAGWTYTEGAIGWGNYDAVLASLEHALSNGPYLLGDRFTMADVILGGTVRYMLRFGMLEARDRFTTYAEHLADRPALHRADARNAAVARERGLVPGQ